MTVIIDGTNGVQSVGGSASTASFTKDGDTNNGIFFPATDVTAITTAGSERLRVDASGNLGIGTTSPGGRLQVVSADNTNTTAIGSFDANNQTQRIQIGFQSIAQYSPSDPIRFLINGLGGTEAARISSGGSLLVGTTTDSGKISVLQTANARSAYLLTDNASNTASVVRLDCSRNTTNSTYFFLECAIPGVEARCLIADSGNITNKNGSYGTISDAKMKTDIVDAGSQWDDIKAVRFRKFKMKNDESGLVQLGVVAQELEQTSPGLVDQHADRDEDGNDLGTTTKSVKTSVLLMKAAVALQEAMTRIEQLEARVAALEAK